MSLTTGVLPTSVVLLAMLTLLCAAQVWTVRGRRRGLIAMLCSVLTVGVFACGQALFGWVPYPFPAVYYVWSVAPVWACCLTVNCFLPTSRQAGAPSTNDNVVRGRRRWIPYAAALLAVPLTLAMVAVRINADYGYYPTVASLAGELGSPQTTLAGLAELRQRMAAVASEAVGTTEGVGLADARTRRATANTSLHLDRHGVVLKVVIPATRSHFSARPAWLWVPPNYLDDQGSAPPALMLLGGTPGLTSDWLRSGNAALTAQNYANRHAGVAPVLVMPDINGSALGDTECVNSARGRAETYLTVDVPTFIHELFGTSLTRSWAVAGLSEGGTCAAMLALRHPDLFAAFADFSGLTSPTLTNAVDARATTRELFGGSRRDYDQHDPLWLVRHPPTPPVAGIWITGTADTPALRAQHTLTAFARNAGMNVWSLEIRGGRHSFALWAEALAASFPQLTQDVGLDARTAASSS